MLEESVVKTFANWPRPGPAEGQVTYQVTYIAPCACGREAEWSQAGQATATRLEIRCDCRDGDTDH